MTDREVDPWVFSGKGKLGGSDVFIEGQGGVTSPIFLKLQESRPNVGHPAREMAKVYSVTFFISNSILLLLLVGQIVKSPHPPA